MIRGPWCNSTLQICIWLPQSCPWGYSKLSLAVFHTSSAEIMSVYLSQSVQRYVELYNDARGDFYSKYHGYAYDGVWVIAKAIDNIIRQNGGHINNTHFRSDAMKTALNNTNFLGVTVRTHSLDVILGIPWWRYQMEAFSALVAICAGWIPRTKASDAELWCFLWSASG